MPTPTELVRNFVEAMNTSDMAAVADSFDPGVEAYIGNAQGGTDKVVGRDEMLARFPDFAAMADSFRATVTQIHEIDARTVLFMVEIDAQRLGNTLHNFAGIFCRLSEQGRISEYRMVEALPAESDRFWAAAS
jgi:limonene-1,2-epoxide hydrolase